MMQNWEHLEDIVSSCNKLPLRDSITNDIHRVRECFLDETSAQFRQMIVTSQFITPIMLSLFNRNPNRMGKARTVDHYKSCMPTGVPQKFRKFQTPTIAEAVERRFEFFS